MYNKKLLRELKIENFINEKVILFFDYCFTERSFKSLHQIHYLILSCLFLTLKFEGLFYSYKDLLIDYMSKNIENFNLKKLWEVEEEIIYIFTDIIQPHYSMFE